MVVVEKDFHSDTYVVDSGSLLTNVYHSNRDLSSETTENNVGGNKAKRASLYSDFGDLDVTFVDEDLYSYSWLPTQNMWADMMTKEMQLPPSL